MKMTRNNIFLITEPKMCVVNAHEIFLSYRSFLTIRRILLDK